MPNEDLYNDTQEIINLARKYEEKKQMETIGLVVLGGILLFFWI